LTALEVDPNVRAENVTITQYCRLAEWLTAHPTSQE